LLRDLPQEPARAAREQARLAAEADGVDGGLHRARVVEDLLLLHGAGGVGAVREDDQRLAARLVLDPLQALMDGVVDAGGALGLAPGHTSPAWSNAAAGRGPARPPPPGGRGGGGGGGAEGAGKGGGACASALAAQHSGTGRARAREAWTTSCGARGAWEPGV